MIDFLNKLVITEQMKKLIEPVEYRCDAIDGIKLVSEILATIAMIEQWAPRGFEKELFTGFNIVH